MKTTMKKIIASILILVLTVSICPIQIAFATDTVASGECGENGDNLTWTLTDSGTLTISGSGNMAGHWLTDKDKVKEINIESGVTSIGDWAFYKCSNLTSINIPDTVTSIGSYAFNSCKNLTNLVIGNGITSIGDSAFSHCRAITSVTIPEGVTSIGAEAFHFCDNLTNVILPDSVISIGDRAFSFSGIKTFTIPKGLKTIGNGAFSSCRDLTSFSIADGNILFIIDNGILYDSDKTILFWCKRDISGNLVLPSSLKRIEEDAFCCCTALRSITIPESVTSIGEGAFAVCTNLSSITIGNNLTEIGARAFVYTSYYETESNWENNVLYLGKYLLDSKPEISGEIIIKDGIKLIADNAFSDRLNITSIILPHSMTNIGNRAFSGCKSLKSVKIPDSVISIGDDTFYQCESLTSVTIGNSVTTIGNGAFSDCISLPNVTIPDSVISIGQGAFSNCSSLSSVTIGSGVKSIGSIAFYNCNAITDVYYANSREMWIMIDGWAQLFRPDRTIHYNSHELTNNIASGTCGENLTWTLTKDGKLTISGTGEMEAYTRKEYEYSYITTAPWGEHYLDINNVVIKNGVTSIGSYAFYKCYNITSVTIPDSVTCIGNNAFEYCTSLASVTIPDSVTTIGEEAFRVCYRLANENGFIIINDKLFDYHVINDNVPDNLIIPEGVTSIGRGALSGLLAITSVTIPDTVLSIGEDTLSECDNLKDIYYMGTDTEWELIDGKLNLPKGCVVHFKEIIQIASGECGEKLTWTLDSDGVLTISGQGEMKTEGMFSYPWYSHRSEIKALIIEDGVTKIPDNAFYSCYNLTTVSIPKSLTEISETSFIYCYSINKFIVDSENIAFIAKDDVLLSSDMAKLFAASSAIKGDYSIPDGVVKICNYAFYDNQNIISVTIPESVETIGSDAFTSCKNLESFSVSPGNKSFASIDGALYSKDKSVLYYAPKAFKGEFTIPDGVSRIEEQAFYGCSNITAVKLPDSVNSIGNNAFIGTALYRDKSNWDNGALYHDNCLIKMDNSVSGDITIKDGTRVIADLAVFGNSNITSVTIPDSVEYAGDRAFVSCNNIVYFDTGDGVKELPYIPTSKLETVIIGKNIKEIPERAFGYCNELKSVVIHEGVESIGYAAFNHCGKLESIELPESLITIGESAFEGCSALSAITIPDSVTEIGKNAFYNNTALKKAVIGSGVRRIGDSAFYYCPIEEITIPRSVREIGERVFNGCKSLASITIENGLKTISNYAFEGCKSITGIVLPDSVENMGKGVFSVCEKLESITLSNNLQSIEENAFYYCKSLNAITIPSSVKSIGRWAFIGCDSLTEVTIPGSVEVIGERAFGACAKLANLTIQDGVKEIGEMAFANDDELKTTVTIPGSVKKIGKQAFYACDFVGVELCDGIEYIEDEAFLSCSKLEAITIPGSVKSIGQRAFSECLNISEIIIEDGVERIGNKAFTRINKLSSITIPKSINSIGVDALIESVALTDIYFGGSEEEWNVAVPNLTLRDSVTIHYNGSLASANCGDNAVADVRKGGKIVISGEGAVTKIDSADPLFTEAKSLKLGDSVTAIGAGAFSDCESLKGAVLPKSIESIGDGAFGENVKNIYFAGSEAEWKAISGSDKLTGVTVHFDGKSAIGEFAADNDKLKCEIYCEEGSASTAFAPVFDENGRFLRIEIVELEAGEINIFSFDSAGSIEKASLIVADDGFAPICEAKEYSAA